MQQEQPKQQAHNLETNARNTIFLAIAAGCRVSDLSPASQPPLTELVDGSFEIYRYGTQASGGTMDPAAVVAFITAFAHQYPSCIKIASVQRGLRHHVFARIDAQTGERRHFCLRRGHEPVDFVDHVPSQA